MAIADGDVSVDTSGNIRWTGGAVSATQYSVLELHRWLQKLADDQQWSGDDQVDITVRNPSERSTDQIIELFDYSGSSGPTFNIDDTMAQHLYDGSITQEGGDVVYSGLRVDGAVNLGTTEFQIIQNNEILPNYWGTGLNAVAASNIIHQGLVKTRTGGTDIDGKRIRIQGREWLDSFFEFSVTLGTGVVVAFLQTVNDINNTTAEATVAGYTTITNIEGYQTIDLGNGNGAQPYYSQWTKATYTINQMYERTKWIVMRSLTEASYTTTDQNNNLGNGTISRQAQTFTTGGNAMFCTRARVRLKIGAGSPTGNITAKLYSDLAGPNTLLATSGTIPADRILSTYQDYEFTFTGAELYEMAASTDYWISFEFTGDASNYLHVAANSTGSDGRADYTGMWNLDLAEDLYCEVDSSFEIHGMPGEKFRGITHEWDIDTYSGTIQENEIFTWGSGATAGSAILLACDDLDGPTGTVWVQLLTGVVPTDPMTLTGGTSTETVEINGSVTARPVSSTFLGQSTGSSLIGSFGIGVDKDDLTQNDLLTDLLNAQQQPPNNVQFDVIGCVVGEDRVLVTNNDATTLIDYNQMTLATTLNGGSETVVDVGTGNIPDNTPSSGTIRVQLDTGAYRYVVYDSHDGDDEFTLNSSYQDWTDPNDSTAGKNVFVSYIDKLATATTESFTTIYTSPQTLRITVRDGGGSPIKTFSSTAALGSSGGSSTVGRVEDD